MEFSEQTKAELDKILTHYPRKEAALLPALYLAQREFGCVTHEAMAYVASLVGVSPARAYGVATFYTMYNQVPTGKHLIQVCMNISCAIRGAEEVLEYLSQKLGIKAGETTPDNLYTLMKVECLGACGNAPMMQIDDEYYEDLTPAKVDDIFSKMK